MDWQNITLTDVLVLLGFLIAYPIYWYLSHKLLNELFD